jgi:hypothetical protein
LAPLTQYMAMNRVNTRGIDKANKVILMSAMAYNLKKYLKFIKKEVRTKAQEQRSALTNLFSQIQVLFMRFKLLKLRCQRISI